MHTLPEERWHSEIYQLALPRPDSCLMSFSTLDSTVGTARVPRLREMLLCN